MSKCRITGLMLILKLRIVGLMFIPKLILTWNYINGPGGFT
jgi:hypothetical protein